MLSLKAKGGNEEARNEHHHKIGNVHVAWCGIIKVLYLHYKVNSKKDNMIQNKQEYKSATHSNKGKLLFNYWVSKVFERNLI